MNQNGDPANGDCVQFFSNPMVEEMSNALSVKCEPCVLTDYTKLFVALDGILGADLDFEEQGGYLTCSVSLVCLNAQTRHISKFHKAVRYPIQFKGRGEAARVVCF